MSEALCFDVEFPVPATPQLAIAEAVEENSAYAAHGLVVRLTASNTQDCYAQVYARAETPKDSDRSSATRLTDRDLSDLCEFPEVRLTDDAVLQAEDQIQDVRFKVAVWFDCTPHASNWKMIVRDFTRN